MQAPPKAAAVGLEGTLESELRGLESRGNLHDSLQFLVHALLTMTSHDKTLIFELLRHVTGS
jgi:hypothetical protein